MPEYGGISDDSAPQCIYLAYLHQVVTTLSPTFDWIKVFEEALASIIQDDSSKLFSHR